MVNALKGRIMETRHLLHADRRSVTLDPLLAQHLRQAPGITLTTKAIHLDPNKYAYMAEGTIGLVFMKHWLKISIKVSFDAGIFMASSAGKGLRSFVCRAVLQATCDGERVSERCSSAVYTSIPS